MAEDNPNNKGPRRPRLDPDTMNAGMAPKPEVKKNEELKRPQLDLGAGEEGAPDEEK